MLLTRLVCANCTAQNRYCRFQPALAPKATPMASGPVPSVCRCVCHNVRAHSDPNFSSCTSTGHGRRKHTVPASFRSFARHTTEHNKKHPRIITLNGNDTFLTRRRVACGHDSVQEGLPVDYITARCPWLPRNAQSSPLQPALHPSCHDQRLPGDVRRITRHQEGCSSSDVLRRAQPAQGSLRFLHSLNFLSSVGRGQAGAGVAGHQCSSSVCGVRVCRCRLKFFFFRASRLSREGIGLKRICGALEKLGSGCVCWMVSMAPEVLIASGALQCSAPCQRACLVVDFHSSAGSPTRQPQPRQHSAQPASFSRL